MSSVLLFVQERNKDLACKPPPRQVWTITAHATSVFYNSVVLLRVFTLSDKGGGFTMYTVYYSEGTIKNSTEVNVIQFILPTIPVSNITA